MQLLDFLKLTWMALDSPATEAPSLRAFASFASLLVVRCQRWRACWAAAMSSSTAALQPCAVCIAFSTAAASSALLCFSRASRAVCSLALACDASSCLTRSSPACLQYHVSSKSTINVLFLARPPPPPPQHPSQINKTHPPHHNTHTPQNTHKQH